MPTFEVTARVNYIASQFDVAYERFISYLTRNGWKRLPRTELGIKPSRTQVKCTSSGYDRCVVEIFRIQHDDPDKTQWDAQQAVRDGIFATGKLGHLVEIAVIAYHDAVKKGGDIIEQVGDDARNFTKKAMCASIEASTGLKCSTVIAGAIVLGLGYLYLASAPLRHSAGFAGLPSGRRRRYRRSRRRR